MQTIDRESFHTLVRVIRGSRGWVRREQDRYDIHPMTVKLMLDVVRPKDWHRVVLEWPHVSLSDPSRVAYTRDNKSGEADRQVVTSLGKYIRERWDHSDLPDHVLRQHVDDYVVRHTNSCEWLVQDVYEYIHAVQNGPNSCMRWDDHDGDGDDHPYRCYDPKYGWRMAVRRNGSKDIVGRALALDHPDFGKVYVRTFKAENDNPYGEGYSHSDEKLAAFLESEGYKHRHCYPEGAKLYTRALRHGHYLGPYMDGGTHNAVLHRQADGEHYFVLDDDGEFSLRDTNGLAIENERCTCERCGARVTEDEIHSTGVDGDYSVCNSCIDSAFTYVEGVSRYGGAYILDDEVVTTVEGDSIVPNTRSADEYHFLDYGQHEGEWTHIDNTVCDIDGNYWHDDDVGDDLLQLDGDSKHAHEYVDADDVHITACGRHFHADDVGETIIELEHGVHDGAYVLLDETVTDSDGERWHEDDIDKYIKKSALDYSVYVAIDQLEIVERETE